MLFSSRPFYKAVRFINANIDQPLPLSSVATAAGCSLATLKREFKQAVNVSPGAFIRRLRMELAFHTLQSKENSVLTAALAAGFHDQSAFARQFKKIFGYSPKHGRDKINVVSELLHIELDTPNIVELNDICLQVVTEQGSYFESAPKAWQTLKEKLHKDELSDDFTGSYFGIGHDNPHEGNVAAAQVRFSAGVSHISRNLAIQNFVIQGGYYGQFHFKGKVNRLGLAYHYIYGQWQEKTEYTIDFQKPAFTFFAEFPNPTVEQHISIYVPLIL